MQNAHQNAQNSQVCMYIYIQENTIPRMVTSIPKSNWTFHPFKLVKAFRGDNKLRRNHLSYHSVKCSTFKMCWLAFILTFNKNILLCNIWIFTLDFILMGATFLNLYMCWLFIFTWLSLFRPLRIEQGTLKHLRIHMIKNILNNINTVNTWAFQIHTITENPKCI